MPRLPDRDSLGARPIPRANRNVVSVAGRGNLAAAGAQLGERLQAFGQQQIEKEDRLSYAAARASFLNASDAVKRELQDDPNYDTFEQRYTERMAKARADAQGMIQSRSDRQLFETEVGTDQARGLGQVLDMARTKRIAAGRAQLDTAVYQLQDSALNSPDEGTRTAALKTINDLYDGAIAQGILDPVQAGDAKRKAGESYTVSMIDRSLMADDVSGARAMFEANRGRLDNETEIKIEADIVRRERGRLAVTRAEQAVYGAPVTPLDPRNEGEGATTDRYFQSLVAQESGGRRGVEGPQTQYGKAQGLTQMLPATAKAMAEKIGVPWKPSLMTGTSKEAGDYQLLLGRAYFDEGLKRYGGDVRKALMFYHGGPDESIWGAKTRAYADQVMARANGGVAPIQPGARQYDKGSVYSNIDAQAAREGWSIEEREAVKSEADRMVARDEGLLRRQQDKAYDDALTIADNLGDKFTDISMLGSAGRNLSPEQRHTLLSRAEANRQPKEVRPNGETALEIEVIAVQDPKSFAAMDLRGIQHLVTPAEFEKLALDQAKLRAGGVENPNANIRGEIHSAIQFYGPEIDLDIGGRKTPKQREQYMRVSGAMRSYLDRVTEGKRKPTDDEMKAAFDSATMEVIVRGGGTFGRDKTVRRYQLEGDEQIGVAIPADVRARIMGAYQRQNGGKTPPDTEIGRIYMQHKGEAGFWK